MVTPVLNFMIESYLILFLFIDNLKLGFVLFLRKQLPFHLRSSGLFHLMLWSLITLV